MARKKRKSTELSVFKGREAKLNRAIFNILAHDGPTTIYGLYKHISKTRTLKGTHYASVNKRVRHLEELGYVKTVSSTKTKAGFKASLYELNTIALLSMVLSNTDLDSLLPKLSEESGLTILAVLSGQI